MIRWRRALTDWLAAAAVGAVIFAWFGHAFLNYDTFYALVWGNQIGHGHLPDYTVPVAPTPHPLAELVGVILTPLGSNAEGVMLAIGLLALGMLVVGLFRLGHELFGVWTGLLAAAIIATRVPILSFGIRGYVDLPTVAFVTWALVLEVRRPYRGASVLILLGLAGLLRPEAWLYAALYWFWLVTTAPRADAGAAPNGHNPNARRSQIIQWTLLAAAAPIIWLLSDLIITGNPLHSLTGTHDLAAQLGRKTGITALVTVGPRRLGEILRLEVMLAALVGLYFTLRWMRQRAHLPLVVAIANFVAYAAFAIANLPLLGRYLFVAATMLALFAGAGALGWTPLPRTHPAWRSWRAVGVVALAAIVVLFPLQQVDRLNLTKDDIGRRARIQSDLKELVQRPVVKRALHACARVYVPTHRPVPLIALYADVRPTKVEAPAGRASGCLVVPANPQVAALAVLDPNEPSTAQTYKLSGPVQQNRSWRFARSGTLQGSEAR